MIDTITLAAKCRVCGDPPLYRDLLHDFVVCEQHALENDLLDSATLDLVGCRLNLPHPSIEPLSSSR